MKNKQFYDLDGTLSRINNTFDFIFRFYLYKRYRYRYYFGKIANKIISKLTILPYTYRRRLLITILFYGIKKADLIKFYKFKYKKYFMENLTELGYKLLKNKNSNGILLTGCTEIPANSIGKIFNLKMVISTEFVYKNNRIVGIKKDTFGNFKLKYVTKKKNDKFEYYTDDIKTECDLKKIMDKIILINENEN